MTKIKICGLTREEDIKSVNLWLPDYIGFVFCKSRRQIDPNQAGKLKKLLDERIRAAGVFVNAPLDFIERLFYDGIIDIVQLHGDESPAYISKLKNRIPCPVIKAVRVKNADQILKYEKFPCDILLLDAYVEGFYGGSGKTFDHSVVPKLNKEFFIAGGLNMENIERTIKMLEPCGVDISSGVETNGIKDDDKISKIVRMVRSLDKKA